MAANHPCSNTKMVRHLRQWFKENDPKGWAKVYQNLKTVWDGPNHGCKENWKRNRSPMVTFLWDLQPQGREYWATLHKRVFGYPAN